MEADGATREGRGTDLPGPAIRSRPAAVLDEVRERQPAQHRCPRRAAIHPQEVQGPHH